MEYLAQDGLFSVDVAIISRGGRIIAVEVDGPYHYTLNTHQPLGHTLLRYEVHLRTTSQVASINTCNAAMACMSQN